MLLTQINNIGVTFDYLTICDFLIYATLFNNVRDEIELFKKLRLSVRFLF